MQFEILSEEKKFYETLYKSQRSEILTHPNETFFETQNVTSLNEEEKCLSALKELKNYKSPGTDDLSVEFYNFFLVRNQYRYNRKLQLRLQIRNAFY